MKEGQCRWCFPLLAAVLLHGCAGAPSRQVAVRVVEPAPRVESFAAASEDGPVTAPGPVARAETPAEPGATPVLPVRLTEDVEPPIPSMEPPVEDVTTGLTGFPDVDDTLPDLQAGGISSGSTDLVTRGGAVLEPFSVSEAGKPATGETEVLEEPVGLPIPDHPRVAEVLNELSGPRRRSFEQALARGGRYLPMIRGIFREEGIPEDLAYLSLVESHFLPAARSSAGAVGLWQFIASTARASGLRVDWWVDERLDPEMSTRAAARHLAELHQRFGDWDLALAAYNAGAGGISRALTATGVSTFWELVAASAVWSETARYVPKFYATLTLARDLDRYGVSAIGDEPSLDYDTVWVDTPVDLVTASRLGGQPVTHLALLNPALERRCTPPGADRYPLRVPKGVGDGLGRALGALEPSSRLSFRRYRLRPGDTLWGIGNRFRTKSSAIAELNRISDPRALRPGREIVVPAPVTALKTRRGPVDRGVAGPVHVVAAGDTVWGIAQDYGVTVRQILDWNDLGRSGVIRPQEVLVVGSPEHRSVVTADHRVHVVRPGDTLWALARQYGVSLADLRRWNRLSAGAVLLPGNRLQVSSGQPS